MSEKVEKELNELKTYLINEYKANGGTKNVATYTAAMLTEAIESLKRVNALKEEIAALKAGATPDIKTRTIGTVDQSRENQSLAQKAAQVLGAYADYLDPVWDERSLEDERFLRDNQLIKDGVPSEDSSVVILRDSEGRLA